MEITTEMIKELRAATGAGILDCRKALTEADGDFQKAVDWLREKGMATAAKRADRDASQGIVELYSHGGGRVGVRLNGNAARTAPRNRSRFPYIGARALLCGFAIGNGRTDRGRAGLQYRDGRSRQARLPFL